MTALLVVVGGVCALLLAEFYEKPVVKAVAKPIASAAFIAIALQAGAMQSAYGKWVLIALALCWAGDVLLIPQGSGKAFLAGLGAFLLGHVAFAGGFLRLGLEGQVFGAALLAMAGPAVVITRWLLPHVSPSMKVPVLAYLVTISVMVTTSVAASAHTGRWDLAIGATLFLCSDLAVARERFVKPTFTNKLWGLPLYYAAQVVLAYSV